MTEEERTKEYVDKSIRYRGIILHEICMMEWALNTFISNHFCTNNPTKSFQMSYVVLGDDRITISSKAQIFKHLAETNYPDWYNAYKSLRKKQPKKPEYTLGTDMAYCIEQRNIFAHRILDGDTVRITHPDYVKKQGDVRFIKLKNEISPIDYNDEQINELAKLISHIRKYIIVDIK